MKGEDITGGLDLLGDWLDAKGYTEEAGLCTRAMDEINALRAELETYTGSRAIVDRFPHHTRIRIFDRQQDADDRRRF